MNVESTPWISCSAFSDWTGWIRVKRIPVGFGLFLAGMGHEIHKCLANAGFVWVNFASSGTQYRLPGDRVWLATSKRFESALPGPAPCPAPHDGKAWTRKM